jgi:hypothetical protein
VNNISGGGGRKGDCDLRRRIIVTGAAGHLHSSFLGFWNHLEASASCLEGALDYVIPDLDYVMASW